MSLIELITTISKYHLQMKIIKNSRNVIMYQFESPYNNYYAIIWLLFYTGISVCVYLSPTIYHSATGLYP